MKGEKTVSKDAEIQAQGKQNKSRDRQEMKIIQLIVFNLGGEEFAAEIGQVREIIRTGFITPIPDSPEFIKGISNVRGEISVVIDLRERLFLSAEKQTEKRHIIVTEQENNLFGLMVDEVTEVLRIPETEIKPAPELVSRIDTAYIRGVLTLEDRLIMFLDLIKVLSDKEFDRLMEISKRYQASVKKEEQKAEKEDVQPEDQKEEQVEEKMADNS